MKKFLFSMFFAFGIYGCVLAQSPEQINKSVSKEIVKRTEVMKLDETQKTKVKEVLTVFYTERASAKKLEGAERKTQMRAVSKKFNSEMAAICTPEQLEAWDKYKEEEKASRK